MTRHALKLIKKELVAENTMAFHFEKPDGFTYKAGQYGDFTLIDPPATDAEGNTRTFSLASAPFEPDLVIATRLRNTAFKNTLKHLPEGEGVAFEGPFGSLTFPADTSRPVVFLTGGIGATLARSMIAQAAHDGAPHGMTFFYSNPSPKDAVFLDELVSLAQQNKNFMFVPTMTDAAAGEWAGSRGPITLAMLTEHISDITAPIYYLSGSGEMVGAMRRMLMAAGVDRNSIRSDQFVGY